MTVGPPHADPGTGPGSFAAPRVSIITATYNRGNVLRLVIETVRYEDPDHWRLPPDPPKIPYSFRTAYLSDGLR
jgi:hypothetical protein